MSETVDIHDLLNRKVLVTRDSARSLADALGSAITLGGGGVVLDFSGVEGMTPSFLDEVLQILEEAIDRGGGGRLTIEVKSPPTRLSSKFEAVGRGHGMIITENSATSWLIAAA